MFQKMFVDCHGLLILPGGKRTKNETYPRCSDQLLMPTEDENVSGICGRGGCAKHTAARVSTSTSLSILGSSTCCTLGIDDADLH